MPKRSNQFQRLIVSIHHALAGDRAVVEESRELRDRVTGTLREVDIVIESAVGDYPVFLCVECCDRSGLPRSNGSSSSTGSTLRFQRTS